MRITTKLCIKSYTIWDVLDASKSEFPEWYLRWLDGRAFSLPDFLAKRIFKK